MSVMGFQHSESWWSHEHPSFTSLVVQDADNSRASWFSDVILIPTISKCSIRTLSYLNFACCSEGYLPKWTCLLQDPNYWCEPVALIESSLLWVQYSEAVISMNLILNKKW